MTSPDAFSLTRLFIAPENAVAPATLTQDWVGAVMTAWDPVALTNTVKVGPVFYTNLPVVNAGQLAVGTVMLAKMPGGYTIIGMIGASAGTVTTYTKTYVCTGSRSYNGNTGLEIPSPDGDNNMYTWYLSGRSYGNEEHMWTFDAATMRTDLTGATITSARMWLYCFGASSDPADYNFKWSTTAALATSWPNDGFAGIDVKNLWHVNTWNSVDITSQMSNILAGGANSVLGGSYDFFDSSTGMRGYGFSVALRPYIAVVYNR